MHFRYKSTRVYVFTPIIGLCTSILFPSCGFLSDDGVITLGNGNDVEVQLQIHEGAEISKIQLYSETENYSLTESALKNKRCIRCSFSEKGEGLVNVVVYAPMDTVSSQHYVESGYTVKLVYAGGKIKTINPTGY